MREVLIRWTLAGGSSTVLNVLHYPDEPNIALQRESLGTFLTAMTPLLGKGTGWTIDTEGRQLDPATGILNGDWNDPTPYTGVAAGNATPAVANASSLLVRLKTSTITNGRRVQGRMFLPGFRNEYLLNGDVAPGLITVVNDALAAWAGLPAGPVVWSRPVDGRPGSDAAVASGSVWSEWAVQRRRRG
uniref:Uncharacterized protein n=1 Tax=uncultured prokaryote TaxID=198431 RepID=A0A0H5QP03_9ZZZZ|nr:hypothetical protein [uncultured prokaryote]